MCQINRPMCQINRPMCQNVTWGPQIIINYVHKYVQEH